MHARMLHDTVKCYERDPSARANCIAHWGLACSVCGFTFASAYGQALGGDYIHVHHLKPLAEIGIEYGNTGRKLSSIVKTYDPPYYSSRDAYARISVRIWQVG